MVQRGQDKYGKHNKSKTNSERQCIYESIWGYKISKILDEQVKIYGRNKKAVQETICICKDKNILREYLENKESEVVDIMMQLYNQEEIMRMHDKSIERESGIMNVVIALREVGVPFSEIVNKIAKQFCLSKEIAEKEVQEYWEE